MKTFIATMATLFLFSSSLAFAECPQLKQEDIPSLIEEQLGGPVFHKFLAGQYTKPIMKTPGGDPYFQPPPAVGSQLDTGPLHLLVALQELGLAQVTGMVTLLNVSPTAKARRLAESYQGDFPQDAIVYQFTTGASVHEIIDVKRLKMKGVGTEILFVRARMQSDLTQIGKQILDLAHVWARKTGNRLDCYSPTDSYDGQWNARFLLGRDAFNCKWEVHAEFSYSWETLPCKNEIETLISVPGLEVIE